MGMVFWRLPRAWALTIGFLLVAACTPATRPASPPKPAGAPLPERPSDRAVAVRGLPTVPPVVDAPLRLTVRYPAERQLLASRDSNFLLGSVGSGDALLTVNGISVPVAPNGAFIAWVPNPSSTAPQYRLEATRGSDTARLTRTVRLITRRLLPADGALLVDSASRSPASGWWGPATEWVPVSLRAPRNAAVTLVGQGGRRVLLPGDSLADLAARTDSSDAGTLFAAEVPLAWLADSTRPARFEVVRATDSVRIPIPAARRLPADQRLLARLAVRTPAGSDTDQVIVGRTIPDGTYKWLLLPGTILEVTGRRNGFTRLRLDGALDVWVASSDVELLPEGSVLPRRVTGGFRVVPDSGWVDVVIPMGDRPAHHVESAPDRLILTLYGVQANPEISPLFGNDTLVRRIHWEQVTSDRVRLELALSQPAYGWLSRWDAARRAFVLRIRRLPAIDAVSPLKGLTIAVDAGHPPAGSTGPTGLFEGDAVLPVAAQVVALLEARGARALSTRTTRDPVDLAPRTVMARRADAHAFVSIHLNALPDGVNPFTANGTSTLFYHQASEPLARVVQEELVARFGLRDLGVHYQNLAVARPSWYPSVLTEGLFVIIPEQEAAMRDPGFQARYAEAIVAGLERYFRSLAR